MWVMSSESHHIYYPSANEKHAHYSMNIKYWTRKYVWKYWTNIFFYLMFKDAREEYSKKYYSAY